MASAGMVVVTTHFGARDADAMAALSANIIAVAPTVETVEPGSVAAARVDDPPARVAGAAVAWLTDWNESFGPAVEQAVRHFIEAELNAMATGDLLKYAGAALVALARLRVRYACRAVLEIGGVFMGDAVNVTVDAMAFEPLHDEYINAVLTETGGLDYRADFRQLAAGPCRRVAGGSQSAFERILEGGRAMGLEDSWAMYLLPMIAEVFPQFQFIHVIRDGRDMATASNQLQRDKHAAALFGAADGDPRVTAARLWAKPTARRPIGRRDGCLAAITG